MLFTNIGQLPAMIHRRLIHPFFERKMMLNEDSRPPDQIATTCSASRFLKLRSLRRITCKKAQVGEWKGAKYMAYVVLPALGYQATWEAGAIVYSLSSVTEVGAKQT